MDKLIFKIKTETELQLSVGSAITSDTVSNVETVEVLLQIHGYDPNKVHKHAEVDSYVLVSKQECKRLIKVLELLSL